MRVPKTVWTASSALALVLAAGDAWSQFYRDLGREVLPANDGWAASGAGTTGGSAAVPAQVYVVRNRQELAAALNNGIYTPPSSTNPSNEPKIIYIDGTIDANVDDVNRPLTCQNYYAPGYSLEAFLLEYDPNGPWGRNNPTGALETARLASVTNQQNRVRLRVGSNTTIVGLRRNATLRGVWLDLRGSAATPRTNIIIRNITFQDTYDCFPAWAPTDGALGSWNALYDSISLRDTMNVWIDHNTFEDVTTADATLPLHFGVLYQVHDGLLDITNASDLVTVSWNRFRNHDKNMLIGSSDSAAADVGKLRVTLHHNVFEQIGQRAPRVRFGQVHAYNNLYRIEQLPTYGYSWGVGVHFTPAPAPVPPGAGLYAENNYFETDETVTPDQFIERFNGNAIHATGTLVNGRAPSFAVDVVAAWNAVNDPDLATDVGWTPTLFTTIDPTRRVPTQVGLRSGPFAWRFPPPPPPPGRGPRR